MSHATAPAVFNGTYDAMPGNGDRPEFLEARRFLDAFEGGPADPSQPDGNGEQPEFDQRRSCQDCGAWLVDTVEHYVKRATGVVLVAVPNGWRPAGVNTIPPLVIRGLYRPTAR